MYHPAWHSGWVKGKIARGYYSELAVMVHVREILG